MSSSDFHSVYVCLVSLQHLNVFKYIHISYIIIVEIFIQMFLTIAPKMISKKTAHQPRISYLVLDEAEDFWDALTKVSFARGRVLGSGSFPLQLLRLLKPTVSDPSELERKAAVASCCHKYSVEVFFLLHLWDICVHFHHFLYMPSTKKLVRAP